MALVLVGCGGGGGGGRHDASGNGEVTGLVVDASGSPVRGATVYSSDGSYRQTLSDSSGAYVLGGLPDADLNIRATITVGGVEYRGVNLGRVFRNSDGTYESTPNVNIAVYPKSQLVSLFGFVSDSSGHALQNVRVSARPSDGKVRSSASAVTALDGTYEIDGLAQGVPYGVVASAQGFGDDAAAVTIPSNPSNDQSTQNFTLKNVTTAAPDVPTGVFAIAFTTPFEPTTRSAPKLAVYDAVQKMRYPRLAKLAATKAKGKGRDSSIGDPISIDVTWDEYPTNPTVRPTGFIVTRNDPAPTLDDGYLLEDPLAVLFSDSDVALLPNTSYTYNVVAASTGFDSATSAGQSALSAPATATPLDSLVTQPATGRNLAWPAVAGATTYTVYVYASYPAFSSVSNVVYQGTSTTNGLTLPSSVPAGSYYYLVVGSRTADATNTADTYSDIQSLAVTP